MTRTPQRRSLHNTKRIGARHDLAACEQREIEIARGFCDDIVDHAWPVAVRDDDAVGHAA